MEFGSNWRAIVLAIAALVAMLVAMPVAAQDLISADRPGIADSSTVIGQGSLQVELGGERDWRPDLFTTPLLVRYGMTKQLELRFETAGWAHIPGDDGLMPASIGMKFHFLDTPSLAVIARVFPPSGSGAFRSHQTAADIRLAADKDLNEHWSVEGNLGASHADGDNAATAAATLQYNVSQRIGVFIDAGATSSPSSLLIDGGAAWIIGKDLQLDLSIGARAHGDVPERFVAAGISIRR
jgi:hypothetical protein